jgi:hypothetical protein
MSSRAGYNPLSHQAPQIRNHFASCRKLLTLGVGIVIR